MMPSGFGGAAMQASVRARAAIFREANSPAGPSCSDSGRGPSAVSDAAHSPYAPIMLGEEGFMRVIRN